MFYINYSEYFVFCKRDEHQLYGSEIVPSFRLPFSGVDTVMDGALSRVSACANNVVALHEITMTCLFPRGAPREWRKVKLLIKFSGREQCSKYFVTTGWANLYVCTSKLLSVGALPATCTHAASNSCLHTFNPAGNFHFSFYSRYFALLLEKIHIAPFQTETSLQS
jgi:hypothetical protein